MNPHYRESEQANVPKCNLTTAQNSQKEGRFSKVIADKWQNCVSRGHAREVSP